ncbi:MAG: zinc-ribbon domain-containing protein, partial [Planctomycetota bacterium]
MIVTCPKCQKKYRIDQSRYHEGIKFLRCQTCGETFRFTPPSPESPPKDSRLLELECHGCKKKYILDKSILTPEMTTIPCKTCGLYIPIKTETEADPQEEPGKEPEDVIEPEILSWSSPSDGQSKTPRKQKKAMNFFVAAVIFLLIIAGAYLGYTLFFKKEEIPPILTQTPTKAPEAMIETGPQPLIYLDVNLAILRKLAEIYIPAENKDLGYQIASALYDSLHPERGHLFLYPDPKYQFLPVLLVQSNRRAGLKEALIKKGILNQFLEPSEEGTYRIKRTAFAAAAESNFPIELYRVRLFEKSMVFGPTTLSDIWEGGDKALLSYRIVRFADLVRKPAGLAVMSFLTEDIHEGWEKSITQSLAQDPDPQVAMIAGLVGNFLSNLTKPFKQINSLALGLKFTADKKRILSYAQEFRKGVKGASVYKQLKTGTWEDPETEGFVL